MALDRFAGTVAELGEGRRNHPQGFHHAAGPAGAGGRNERGRGAQSAGTEYAVVRVHQERLRRMRSRFQITAAVAVLCAGSALAQPGVFTKELLIQYTPEWKGERFADGRPKVPDGILKRMKSVTLEEAWAQLRSAGFNHQYEDGWFEIHPGKVLDRKSTRLNSSHPSISYAV